MSWTVTSDRLSWKRGTRLMESDLAGCNIAALVEGGHLRPTPEPKTTKRPAQPEATDTAPEPEEQD